jgi:hypothetical protein
VGDVLVGGEVQNHFTLLVLDGDDVQQAPERHSCNTTCSQPYTTNIPAPFHFIHFHLFNIPWIPSGVYSHVDVEIVLIIKTAQNTACHKMAYK